jgi:hypothetical protein
MNNTPVYQKVLALYALLTPFAVYMFCVYPGPHQIFNLAIFLGGGAYAAWSYGRYNPKQ